MAVKVTFLLFAIALLPALVMSQNCQGPRTRKEFRDMTYEEWTEFVRAVQLLQAENGGAGWGKYADLHINYNVNAHSNLGFLTWHREFLNRMEADLRRVNPRFQALPYWNWAADFEAPHRSPLWTQNYLGGASLNNNRPTCVPNGPFANYRYQGTCVRRGFSLTEGFTTNENGRTTVRLNTWQELMGIIDSNRNYNDFAILFESNSHVLPHIWIGGYQGSMSLISEAPLDVSFIAHHAFLDYLYDTWQRRHGYDNYGGFDRRTGQTYNADTPLQPFNVRPRNLFRISDLCYRYQAYSGNPPPPPVISSTTSRSSTSTATSGRTTNTQTTATSNQPSSSSNVPPPTTSTNPPPTPPSSSSNPPPTPPSSSSNPPPTPPSSTSNPPPTPPSSSNNPSTSGGTSSTNPPSSAPSTNPTSPATSTTSPTTAPISTDSKATTTPGPSTTASDATYTPPASTSTRADDTYVPPYARYKPSGKYPLLKVPDWYFIVNKINSTFIREAEEKVQVIIQVVEKKVERGEYYQPPVDSDAKVTTTTDPPSSARGLEVQFITVALSVAAGIVQFLM